MHERAKFSLILEDSLSGSNPNNYQQNWRAKTGTTQRQENLLENYRILEKIIHIVATEFQKLRRMNHDQLLGYIYKGGSPDRLTVRTPQIKHLNKSIHIHISSSLESSS